jgi:hypothetical protein
MLPLMQNVLQNIRSNGTSQLKVLVKRLQAFHLRHFTFGDKSSDTIVGMTRNSCVNFFVTIQNVELILAGQRKSV